LDPNKIGIFNPIDMAFKIFENSDLFCINSKMNTVFNGKYNYSLGAIMEHYNSQLLSIPITSIIKGNYNNPMNIIFDKYFSISKRQCDNIRCKEGIVNYYLTTYYNNFRFPNILIFVVDSLDFKTLKDNFLNIKNLFNPVLIIDKEEYNLIGYYLLPFANHFTVLFQNQLEDGILKKSSWYLYDDLYDYIFEVIGSIDKILEYYAIHAIIYTKKK
jgi:hypothetical protein